MVVDTKHNYLETVGGIGRSTRAKARAAARSLQHTITAEMEKASGRLGLVRSDDLDEVRSELTGIRSELAETRTALAEARSELAGARSELAEARTGLTEARAEIAGVTTGLADARAELAALRDQAMSTEPVPPAADSTPRKTAAATKAVRATVAKKAVAKKAPARRTAAKKAPAKKAPTRAGTAKQAEKATE
ncbi:hypothetical protein [Microlunatus parietis]|uniref:Chromosome segregation ATPase n=1 Tax=Microlunatus parietis TaxID=682979 RepID=A0A7Y9LAC4_9ACTN|nr:hypothetical protein [Microlunatus parietis]NYE69628.1 chromosome segregation ATPase [Microlunatus parietis]